MHTEDNDNPIRPADYTPQVDADHPGYELEDVNVSGIAVFLAGLFGTVIIFFFVCYGMGILINNGLKSRDGAPTKWTTEANNIPAGKGANLKSNAAIEQDQLRQVANNFPQPRLDVDDGNQATADLHAREDLLLENYSTVDGQPDTIRIPIERAMELIAQRGLPVETAPTATPDNVAHAGAPEIQAPLTTGFARTGYEWTTIEAREQKMEYGKAEK
jgi:hypothetical protein